MKTHGLIQDRNGDESDDGNECSSGDGNGNGDKNGIGEVGREANKSKKLQKSCRSDQALSFRTRRYIICRQGGALSGTRQLRS